MKNKQIKQGSIVRIQSDAIHQETQRPLKGMHGKVYDSNIAGELIVSVAELNGVQLPFSEDEIIVIDNSPALPC